MNLLWKYVEPHVLVCNAVTIPEMLGVVRTLITAHCSADKHSANISKKPSRENVNDVELISM